MAAKPAKGENRTMEQLKEHYEIERELANRLRNASRQERRHCYSSLYDEMYRRVPSHPQLALRSSPAEKRLAVSRQMKFVKPFLGADTIFLEVGSGDCALSLEAAGFVRQVYAVDVSSEVTRGLTRPPINFHLVLSDGSSIPLPPNSVNVAYSNQQVEHLHPDDAFEQLDSIYRTLTPGGTYICITPNRLSGPHDISRYFDEVATGFHLKEYTTSELSSLFRRVGFSRVRAYIGGKGKHIRAPLVPIVLYEAFLERLPRVLRKAFVRILPLRLPLGIRLVGVK